MRPSLRKPKEIPYRNRDHTGWWVASYVERFEFYDENKANPNRRCTAYENTILVQARDREEAYRKSLAFGQRSQGNEGWESGSPERKGAWRFDGLTSLLPVYEELQDGAELLWKEHSRMTVRKVKGRVKRKRELEAFDDRAWTKVPP